MVFMVIEHFRPGRAPDVYRRFRDQGRMAPAQVRYVSSWVDLEFRRCFQVMEADRGLVAGMDRELGRPVRLRNHPGEDVRGGGSRYRGRALTHHRLTYTRFDDLFWTEAFVT